MSKIGATQEWTIEIDGNKYRTHAGQVNGAITTSEWTTCDPKNGGRSNATTAEAQAMLEARAKWNKKRDKNHFERIEDAENGKTRYVEPMLAKNWDSYADAIEYPVLVQPKLDGIRMLAHAGGLFSRNGKQLVSVPHIYDALKPAFENFTGVIFDGELYADKYANDFNKICSIAKKTKPTKADIEFAAKNIEYHIYDRADSPLKFSERFESIRWIFGIDCPACVKIVQTKKLHDRQSVDQWYEHYVAAGYEGQIIRLDAPYENKRSKNLLKRKEFQDAEFEIVDIKEGVGNRNGMAGNMRLRDAEGKEFDSNIKGDFGLLKKYLVDKNKLIGKMATVSYFNLTPAGVPRFPFVIKVDRKAYE